MSDSPSSELHDAPVPEVSPRATSASVAVDGAPRPATVPAHTTPVAQVEPRRARFARRAHRVRLYLYAFLGMALLVYAVALAASNTRRVRVDWVFGRSTVQLVWLVLLAAILGWLLGLLVAGVFRWRTRAPRAS